MKSCSSRATISTSAIRMRGFDLKSSRDVSIAPWRRCAALTNGSQDWRLVEAYSFICLGYGFCHTTPRLQSMNCRYVSPACVFQDQIALTL